MTAPGLPLGGAAGCRLPSQPSAGERPGATPDHEGHDGYVGAARLTLGSARFDVQVELRGYFEPIDGRYHWYGRIARHDGLADALGGGRAEGVLETLAGVSPCELSEPDLWHRYRVTGQSTPPYPVSGQRFRTGEAAAAPAIT